MICFYQNSNECSVIATNLSKNYKLPLFPLVEKKVGIISKITKNYSLESYPKLSTNATIILVLPVINNKLPKSIYDILHYFNKINVYVILLSDSFEEDAHRDILFENVPLAKHYVFSILTHPEITYLEIDKIFKNKLPIL